MFVDYLVFIILFAASRGTEEPTYQSVTSEPCNRLKINELWYEKDVIMANVGRPTHLIVHKTSNILFFSYSQPDSYADLDFQLASINLDTKEHQVIPGMRGGCSVAIDQHNDVIYLGGSDGIYTYNVHTKLADFYKEKGKNIWSLYFKGNLFYISYPDQKLYIDVDGKFIKVSEFEHFEVDNFHVTENNDIYFSNKTGFYKLDGVHASVETINELITVRQIAEDSDERMFVCTNFGIWERSGNELKKLVDMKNIFGLTFDRDNNMIYSDQKNIVQLKPCDRGCLNESHW